MKKIKYLSLLPLLILPVACNNSNSNLPTRKDGNTCNLTFNGEHVVCDYPKVVMMDNELNLNLNIEYSLWRNATWKIEPTYATEGELNIPPIEYILKMEDIVVKIGGKEYPDSFTFFYKNNEDNVLTIKKEYVVNDIDISLKAKPREATLSLYGLELDDEMIELVDKGEVELDFVNVYQRVRKPIRTLSQYGYPIYEDDDIDLLFTSKTNNPLPDNLWLRSNARFTVMGIDFSREYSPDKKSCKFYVPRYIIRDHCSIRNKPKD